MPVLVTADLHFSDKARDAYRHAFVDVLASVIKDRDVTTLLILGDLTEAKNRHDAWLVNQIVGHLLKLADLCDIVIVQGNHDAEDATCPFFGFTRTMRDSVVWISSPRVMTIDDLGKCCFLPHTHDVKDWDVVRKSFSKCSYIFAHNTFAGTKVAGHEFGGIETSVFPKGATVISGDIHVPMTVGPVEYVGAPYLVDFGDDYDPRMILLDGDKVESIDCTGPQKRAVTLKPKNIDYLEDVFSKVNENDIVSARVYLSQNAYVSKWAYIKESLIRFCDERNIILFQVRPILEKRKLDASVAKGGGNSSKSDDVYYDEYAKARGLSTAISNAGKRFL